MSEQIAFRVVDIHPQSRRMTYTGEARCDVCHRWDDDPRLQILSHLNTAYLLSMRKDDDYSDCLGCGFRSPLDPRGHSPTCPVGRLADLISDIEADPRALDHADDYPGGEQ